MTTMTSSSTLVTGGVDTHRDIHVAAALDQIGGLLGTATFATTLAGYRALLGWLVGFGPVEAVGVEGTGSYGAALARYLTRNDVVVVEVGRPNRQVRRRYGKTDVVDAIAAARAVQSGDATAVPKSHDGPVEALRALKTVQRSATKARTQALNQLHALVLTAPEDLRGKLRVVTTRTLITTCPSSSSTRLAKSRYVWAHESLSTLRRRTGAQATPDQDRHRSAFGAASPSAGGFPRSGCSGPLRRSSLFRRS
jgi:hypothetical protein